MPHRDYLVLEDVGEDKKAFIVGDVHGQIGALDAALAKLRPQDVLVIVGDLFDRGERAPLQPTSSEVLDRVMDNPNCAGVTQPQICVIKGNHEVDFLKLADKYLEAKTGLEEEQAVFSEALITFLGNGGAWIINRDTPIGEGLFQWGRHYSFLPKMSQDGLDAKARLSQRIAAVFSHQAGAPSIEDLFIPKFFEYQEFIEGLPFVLKISSDESPAWVVHADCPWTDEELDDKIMNDIPLTERDIDALVWPRPEQFSDRRDQDMRLVYTGHNIIDDLERRQRLLDRASVPVRAKTNTINLDVGAYFSQGLVLLDHVDKTIEVAMAAGASDEHVQYLQSVCAEVQQHFDHLASMPSRKRMKA